MAFATKGATAIVNDVGPSAVGDKRGRGLHSTVADPCSAEEPVRNIHFSQALSYLFDVISSLAFLISVGVCERFPELRFAFLEANGGWLLPSLEPLDHHAHVPLFRFDVPPLKRDPSDYFLRQCWISFDPDESTLAFSARSPMCGVNRIVWASDYPHLDVKFPETTQELCENMESLTDEQQRQIAGENAKAPYDLKHQGGVKALTASTGAGVSLWSTSRSLSGLNHGTI
jgi:hypothetical protein